MTLRSGATRFRCVSISSTILGWPWDQALLDSGVYLYQPLSLGDPEIRRYSIQVLSLGDPEIRPYSIQVCIYINRYPWVTLRSGAARFRCLCISTAIPGLPWDQALLDSGVYLYQPLSLGDPGSGADPEIRRYSIQVCIYINRYPRCSGDPEIRRYSIQVCIYIKHHPRVTLRSGATRFRCVSISTVPGWPWDQALLDSGVYLYQPLSLGDPEIRRCSLQVSMYINCYPWVTLRSGATRFRCVSISTAIPGWPWDQALLASGVYLYKAPSLGDQGVYLYLSPGDPEIRRCSLQVCIYYTWLLSCWSRLLSFLPYLLVDQITHTGNEMCVETSRFANVWSQIKQICQNYTHMKLWFAVVRHNFKWVKN